MCGHKETSAQTVQRRCFLLIARLSRPHSSTVIWRNARPPARAPHTAPAYLLALIRPRRYLNSDYIEHHLQQQELAATAVPTGPQRVPALLCLPCCLQQSLMCMHNPTVTYTTSQCLSLIALGCPLGSYRCRGNALYRAALPCCLIRGQPGGVHTPSRQHVMALTSTAQRWWPRHGHPGAGAAARHTWLAAAASQHTNQL